MFTGIIETLGTVTNLQQDSGNMHITLEAPFTSELKVDQSVAHNGVCLTVIEITGSRYKITAIEETLKKTNIGRLKKGDKVNLERSMLMNGRLDGHIVQGHVDGTAVCTEILDCDGSKLFRFTYEGKALIVSKGSICVNGVSLTVVDTAPRSFSVAVIPYTFEHTTFHLLQKGGIVNIEFDIIGKYITAYNQHMQNH